MTYQPGDLVRRYHYNTWSWVPATVVTVTDSGTQIWVVPGHIVCPVMLDRLGLLLFSSDDIRHEGWFV